MSSAVCFNLDQSKILSSGNGLKSVPCRTSIHKQYTYEVSNQQQQILRGLRDKITNILYTDSLTDG